MNQKAIPGREYVSCSGKGLQGTGKTENSKRQTSAKMSGGVPDTKEREISGVECDIADGSKRVSQWLYGEENNLYTEQTAVIEVKKAQAEAAKTKADAEALQEETGESDKGEEETKVAASGGISTESIEYMERLLESMKESRRNASQKKSTKKALNYNYRKVSTAIMRAKSVSQAGNALTSAKATLSNLRRKSGSSQYNSNELGIAINHARKMVRTARKKLQNMKVEERQRKQDGHIENNRERENNTIQRIQKGDHTAENSKREKELLLLRKKLKQSRDQKKNAHRRDESHELLNADMEYLKRKIELMRQERMIDKIERSETAALKAALAGGGTESPTTADTSAGGSSDTASAGVAQGTAGTAATTGTPSASAGFDTTI